MKVAEGLDVIKSGWIRKPKGFRVKYQKLVEGKLAIEYSPPEDSAPLDSDVVTWRYAWKLYMATKSDTDAIGEKELVNIHVVDDADEKVKYYATNTYEVFNRR